MTHDNDRNNKRILLVDDELDVIYSPEMALEGKGFVVDSYIDPTLASSNFKPGLYDSLLLDIKMPKINGFDLYKRMSEIDSNVKICFLTASELFYERYLKVNAYQRLHKENFMQKPMRTEELICRLNKVLSAQI